MTSLLKWIIISVALQVKHCSAGLAAGYAVSASFKPSEWIEFKFKMAKPSQADKVIIQTLRELGLGGEQDSVPAHAARQT
jgi:hypothetical protein